MIKLLGRLFGKRERRTAERQNLWTVATVQASDGSTFPVALLDVSPTGVRLTAAMPPRPAVTYTIDASAGSERLTGALEVVHFSQTAQGFLWGCRLVGRE